MEIADAACNVGAPPSADIIQWLGTYGVTVVGNVGRPGSTIVVHDDTWWTLRDTGSAIDVLRVNSGSPSIAIPTTDTGSPLNAATIAYRIASTLRGRIFDPALRLDPTIATPVSSVAPVIEVPSSIAQCPQCWEQLTITVIAYVLRSGRCLEGFIECCYDRDHDLDIPLMNRVKSWAEDQVRIMNGEARIQPHIGAGHTGPGTTVG